MSFPSPLNPDDRIPEGPKGLPQHSSIIDETEETKHEIEEEKPTSNYRKEGETTEWVEMDPEVNTFTIFLINSIFF